MRYTRRDRKIIYVLSTVFILGCLIFVAVDTMENFGIWRGLTVFRYGITDLQFDMGWINFFMSLGLLYFTLKGLWGGYKLKEKTGGYLLFSLIFLAYLLIYCPVGFAPFLPLTATYWTAVDFSGAIVVISFLAMVVNKE